MEVDKISNVKIFLLNLSKFPNKNNQRFISIEIDTENMVETLIQKSIELFFPSLSENVQSELHHQGRVLSKTDSLGTNNIQPNSVLHLIVKPCPPQIKSPDSSAPDRAVQGLQELAQQRKLEALSILLHNGRGVKDVLCRNPQLLEDQQGLLCCLLMRNPMLIATLLREPNSVKRTLKEHPALAQSTLQLIQWYRETALTPTTVHRATQHLSQEDFSVNQDEAEDDEEEEESSGDEEQRQQQRGGNSVSTSSTGGQRRRRQGGGGAAAASGSRLNWMQQAGRRSLLQSRSSQGRSSSSGSNANISADMFRSALNAALGSLDDSRGGTSTTTTSTTTAANLPDNPPPLNSSTTVPPPLTVSHSPPSNNNRTTNTNSSSSPAVGNNPRQLFARQLIALREMGVTDEDVALQMLIATSGNLEAAINLMFM